MSETLSESLNNKNLTSVGHSEIPVAENTPEPLLTAYQEEHILNELSIEQSNTQQTVIIIFTTALSTFRANFQRLC